MITNPGNNGPNLREPILGLCRERRQIGGLNDLPWDDMCILTALLGPGGPLWERLLPLGHEWDYISDAQKDPGIFGCVAHYGGRRAEAELILAQRRRVLPAPGQAERDGLLGDDDRTDQRCARWIRGPWGRPQSQAPMVFNDHRSLPLPFCFTWPVPVTQGGGDTRAVLRTSGSAGGPPRAGSPQPSSSTWMGNSLAA